MVDKFEFANLVAKKVTDLSGYEAKVNEIVKNNGVKNLCIQINTGESNISPCIYLNEFYEKWLNGEELIDDICNNICEIYQKHKIPFDFDTSMLEDWETVKTLLSGRLINTEKNKELLMTLPHRELMDLSLIYCIDISSSVFGNGSIKLTYEILKLLNVSEEEVYENVMANMEQEGEILKSIVEVICEMIGDESINSGDLSLPMYVLTNHNKIFGAAQIVRDSVLQNAASVLGSDYYIIPSSVHECLLIAESEIDKVENLANMVREVNDSEVEENEVLSYHVYHYDHNLKELTVAA